MFGTTNIRGKKPCTRSPTCATGSNSGQRWAALTKTDKSSSLQCPFEVLPISALRLNGHSALEPLFNDTDPPHGIIVESVTNALARFDMVVLLKFISPDPFPGLVFGWDTPDTVVSCQPRAFLEWSSASMRCFGHLSSNLIIVFEILRY